MNFRRSNEKNFRKKCATIVSKVGSKESQKNTDQKNHLRQGDYIHFLGLN
jgi:hypothetical protein